MRLFLGNLKPFIISKNIVVHEPSWLRCFIHGTEEKYWYLEIYKWSLLDFGS